MNGKPRVLCALVVLAFTLAPLSLPAALAEDKVEQETELGKRLEGKWVLDMKASKSLNGGNNIGEKKFGLFEFKLGKKKKDLFPKGWREEFRPAKFLGSAKKLVLLGDGTVGKQKVVLATAEGKSFILYIVPNYGVVAQQIILVQANDKESDRLYLRHSFKNRVFNFAYKRKS